MEKPDKTFTSVEVDIPKTVLVVDDVADTGDSFSVI